MGFENNPVMTKNSTANTEKPPNFGTYSIEDEFSINLPNTEIHFQRLYGDKYYYSREGSHSDKVDNLISVRTKNLEVEFVPAFPIYVPAYRTSYVYLSFQKSLFVSKESSTEIFVPVPIENALFFTGPEINEYLDVFACQPERSRFGLYGPPENGRLCKFAQVPVEYRDQDFEPFLYAKMKVGIENELERGVKLGKLIFPITNHDIYYKGKTAVLDDLRLTIKERLGIVHGEVECEKTPMGGWKKAPRQKEKTEYKFSMGWGFS